MARRPEFSRMIPRERLGGGRLTEQISATPDERAKLAGRFDLLGLDRLEATIEIRPGRGKDLLSMSGRLVADATQRCVISLEPVAAHIEQPIDLLFTLASAPAEAEVVLDPAEADWPEEVPREGLDIGEVAAQLLSLALDPYPRRPGATLEQALEEADLPQADESAERPQASPFAALAALQPSGKTRKN